MRRFVAGAVASLLAFCISSVGYGSISLIDFDNGSGTAGVNNDQSVGFQFNVNTALTITALGWYDQGQDGLVTSHIVGIWAPDGTLLASTTVGAGNSATLDGIWRLVDIADVIIGVENGYIVGGTNLATSDFLAHDVSNQTTDPRISFVDATFSGLTAPNVLVRPTFFSVVTTGFYGPMAFTGSPVAAIPEPAALLIWSALGLLGLGLRRQMEL